MLRKLEKCGFGWLVKVDGSSHPSRSVFIKEHPLYMNKNDATIAAFDIDWVLYAKNFNDMSNVTDDDITLLQQQHPHFNMLPLLENELEIEVD